MEPNPGNQILFLENHKEKALKNDNLPVLEKETSAIQTEKNTAGFLKVTKVYDTVYSG